MSGGNGFGYAINTSTINECGLDVAGEIDVAARAGYGGIELWVSEIEAFLAGGRSLADLKGLLDTSAMKVPNLIAFFEWAHPDAGARADALDQAREIFAMARDLGCPYVAAPPWGIAERDDVPPPHIAECYAELLRAAREFGVVPLLEFWGHSKVLKTLDEAVDILGQVGDSSAAMLLDVFHMAKGGSRLGLLGELAEGQVGLVHVNDYPDSPDVTRLTDAERVYPGDGVAPYGEIVRMLERVAYSGVLSLELFNKEYQKAGADEVAKTGIEKLKSVIEAARSDG